MLLPELPEALIVRRNAHGFSHSFTALQMDKYGRDCAKTAQDVVDLLRTVEPMTEVADRYAHRLALELECVLADRPSYYDKAMQVLGEYRSAMSALHEQHSPTRMGEPLRHNVEVHAPVLRSP